MRPMLVMAVARFDGHSSYDIHVHEYGIRARPCQGGKTKRRLNAQRPDKDPITTPTVLPPRSDTRSSTTLLTIHGNKLTGKSTQSLVVCDIRPTCRKRCWRHAMVVRDLGR